MILFAVAFRTPQCKVDIESQCLCNLNCLLKSLIVLNTSLASTNSVCFMFYVRGLFIYKKSKHSSIYMVTFFIYIFFFRVHCLK